MKHIKTFSIFESSQGLTRKQEEFLNWYTRGTWRVNPEGLVDIEGGFNCSYGGLKDLKGVKFGSVTWNFDCSGNFLETLEGAPREVGERFWCLNNPLRSLEGAPEIIRGKFLSDALNVPEGQWSIPNLVTMFLESSGEKKDLLETLVSPEALQKRIDENPEGAAVEMKSIAGLPEYKTLKWPAGLQSEVDLLSDLDRIGL